MNPILKVFVAEHCISCEETHQLAMRVEQIYPDVIVEVIDVGVYPERVPDNVFAIPTFMLNDRIISLGNPTFDEVVDQIEQVVTTAPSS